MSTPHAPIPRLMVAGLRGGGGKTLTALGLTAAWTSRGHLVAPFKKGPDYIDAAWLTQAANAPCRNLDAFLMAPDVIERSFITASAQADISVIEGNRGLHDGMDAAGTYSSGQLAKLLDTPVVLVVDCTKATRTIAAMVLGCQQLDPDVNLAGVILTRTAGTRHESVLRESIEQICGISVVGAIPRLREDLFPERHLGLVPPDEHDARTTSIQRVAEVAEQYLDLDTLWTIAHAAPGMAEKRGQAPLSSSEKSGGVRIGVFRDAAFQFYYPENLEALAEHGAQVIEISPLADAALPGVDALYIGGGFPETLAGTLAANRPFINSLRSAIERGLPVYAECGGAVYLGESLHFNDQKFDMVGALPITFGFRPKPQGHGYAIIETTHENPFFPQGTTFRGHEFHYTSMQSASDDLTFAFTVKRGHGFDSEHDGLCAHNVMACYTHLHALGTPEWAPALVQAATRFVRSK